MGKGTGSQVPRVSTVAVNPVKLFHVPVTSFGAYQVVGVTVKKKDSQIGALSVQVLLHASPG